MQSGKTPMDLQSWNERRGLFGTLDQARVAFAARAALCDAVCLATPPPGVLEPDVAAGNERLNLETSRR